MTLPADVKRYVERTFAAPDRATVLELISNAVIHDGQPAEPRLVRCALISSGGTVPGLRRQLEQLKFDYRDVIVEGEYVPRAGSLVRVRNLNEPIGDANPDECPDRVRSVLESLQIPLDIIKARSLILQPEAEELVVAELGDNGREHLLVPAAANAWRELSSAARADGVTLKIVSAFRSVARQAEIVRGKLARGLSLDAILCVSAPPGYSEHHSGRAVDVTTEGTPPLELEFEETPAFQWLSSNAHQFGFALSFPRQNPYGYAYEPWHWCFKQVGAA